jgi:hypothetical protein
LYVCPAWCGPAPEAKEEQSGICFKRVTLLTGYGSKSIETGHYEVIPILLQFHFNINSVAKRMGVNTGGDFEFIAEPLFNVVTNPSTNAEVGLSLLLRYEGSVIPRLNWFLEGGLGALYTSLHTREQGSQYGFVPQAGLGLQYSLNQRWALTCAYRFRHLSNAGTADDNYGINHNFALVGLTVTLN